TGGSMKNRVIGLALVAALMCGVAVQPAQAPNNVGDFLGIAGGMVRLGLEIDRANTERERANALARQQQQQAAEQRAAFIRRVQTALKTLDYYQMPVDGDAGPGTNRAIAAYQDAFGLFGDMDDAALATLEWHAAQG